MKKTIVIIAAVALCGCGIRKPYARPEIHTDALFGEKYLSPDTASLADFRWQELFTDPFLQALIYQGLEYNADINMARLGIEQAEAALKSARLSLAPSFFFSPEGSLSSFDFGKTTKAYNLPVAASWEIDVWGKLNNAKKRSLAAYGQSREYTEAVRTGLISTVSTLYYTLLMLDRQYEISGRTAENWKKSVETMRLMKEAGMFNQAAIAQSEANYYAGEASLLDLKESINRIENTLSTLLFDAPHRIERGKLSDQEFPSELTYGVPLQMLARRPDVKSAELDLVQAYYATNEARAALYPSLTLSGSAGWTNSAGSYIVNPGKMLLAAAGSLTQPILNRRLNRSQLEIARASQEQAAIRFQQTLLDAGAEVNDALTQYQTARDKKVLIEKQVNALEEALEATRLLMTHGSTTYLEILTAQQGLLQAELADVANRAEEIFGIIGLYHALGGGASEDGPNEPNR